MRDDYCTCHSFTRPRRNSAEWIEPGFAFAWSHIGHVQRSSLPFGRKAFFSALRDGL